MDNSTENINGDDVVDDSMEADDENFDENESEVNSEDEKDDDENKEMNEENSNDEDEDDENELDVADTVSKINRLQDELSSNPYQYEKHVSLIENLRSLGELEILREAREKFSTVYPLSPQLWLEWIEDESLLVTDLDEQGLPILQLYARAVADYFDFNLWLKYVNFATQCISLLTLENVREIFEFALIHAGLHVSRGAELWRIYRQFEVELVTRLPNIDPQQQEVKVYELYKRQFSIPLLGMDSDWTEFTQNIYPKQTNNQKDSLAQLQKIYEKSFHTLEGLLEYEQKLLEVNETSQISLPLYLEYIEYEQKNENNHARVECLFERAITDNPLSVELWMQYLKYCDSKLVVDKLLFPIYQRAVRNCSWSSDLWVAYIQANERLANADSLNVAHERISLIVENALNHIEDQHIVWNYYIGFLRRKICQLNAWTNQNEIDTIRDAFQQAISSLTAKDIFYTDAGYELLLHYATVEAKYCKNMEEFRRIFADLYNSATPWKRLASFWHDFAQFERLYGNEEEYRKVLHKALNWCNDLSEVQLISYELTRFEQNNSTTLGQLEESMAKIAKAIKKAEQKLAKEEAAKQASTQPLDTKIKQKAQKRKAIDEPIDKSEKQSSETAKKSKLSDKPLAHGVTVKTDESKREQTVFVSNLKYSLTEEEIRETFEQFGPINEVRLVRNYKGVSKGFCYVEFASFESAHEALKHDRMLLQGRPVLISQMDKRTTFSYSTSEEKHKLFVKNIPPDWSKEQLMSNVFSDISDLVVDIRLATFRNGHSKGWAYVEMKDANSAQKAVAEKNDFELPDGRRLLVVISDPSKSRKTTGFKSDPTLERRAGKSNFSGKSANFMLPHSLLVKTQPSKVKLQLSDTKEQPPSTTSQTTITAPKLNNDQFRSMFIHN